MSKFLDAVGLARFKDKLESKWKLKFDEVYNKTEVDELITAKVAEIVAGAPEDFNTLKEMSDWLTEHEDSAASMNSVIQKNAEDIATANTNIAKKLDKTTKYAASDAVGGAATKVKTVKATSNTNRAVVFSDISESDTGSTIPYIDPDIYYNPATNTLTVPNIESDTTAALKNDVAINRTTLGMQCKNLLNPDKHIINRCTEEKDGDTYIVTNTGTWSQWYWFLKGKTGQTYIITFEISELTGDSTLNDIYIKDIISDISIKNFAVRKDGTLSVTFTAVSDGTIRIGWCPNNSGTDRELSFKVSNLMCRSADITDNTYEPYTPSLQELIDAQDTEVKTLSNRVAINKSTLGVQCKNLFKPKQNAGYTQTVSGVSYTFNDDGSITASGTLTGEAALNFSEIYLEAGAYRISSSKIFNVQIYKSDRYVGGSQATPEGTVITISESGTYSFRWYWGVNGAVVNGTVYPMLTRADITDVTFEPYIPDFNTRISVLESLSDVVYKHNNSSRCNIDGYVLRVGNQIHLNLTATFHSSCDSWWGGVLNFPFKVKTPDGSGRYTIKQTQSDGRETSVYISNGSNGIYTGTAFKKGDVITFSPLILDIYVEETTATESGEE